MPANECLTTLPLTVFTQINFVADFLQAKFVQRRDIFTSVRVAGTTFGLIMRSFARTWDPFILRRNNCRENAAVECQTPVAIPQRKYLIVY